MVVLYQFISTRRAGNAPPILQHVLASGHDFQFIVVRIVIILLYFDCALVLVYKVCQWIVNNGHTRLFFWRVFINNFVSTVQRTYIVIVIAIIRQHFVVHSAPVKQLLAQLVLLQNMSALVVVEVRHLTWWIFLGIFEIVIEWGIGVQSCNFVRRRPEQIWIVCVQLTVFIVHLLQWSFVSDEAVSIVLTWHRCLLRLIYLFT